MQLPEPLIPFKIYDFIILNTQGKLPQDCVSFLL